MALMVVLTYLGYPKELTALLIFGVVPPILGGLKNQLKFIPLEPFDKSRFFLGFFIFFVCLAYFRLGYFPGWVLIPISAITSLSAKKYIEEIAENFKSQQ